jgi:hypothetical protein
MGTSPNKRPALFRGRHLQDEIIVWVIKTQLVTAFGGTAERWVLSTGEVGWTKDERGIQQVDSCPGAGL